MNYKKTGECKEVYPKIPVALVLKKKNRERLENWYFDQMLEWLNDPDYQFNIITDGFCGVNNFTDDELIAEYKEWAWQYRDSFGYPPSI